MKKTLLFLIVLLLSVDSYPYNQNKVDSLTKVFNSNVHDTIRIKSLLLVSSEIYIAKPDSDLIICNRVLELANTSLSNKSYNSEEILKFKKQKSDGLANIGYQYMQQGKIDLAKEYFNESLLIKKAINDLKGCALLYNNLGLCFENSGDDEKAIENFNKCFEIRKGKGNKRGMAYVMNNMATVYDNRGDVNLALDHYIKCLKLFEEIDFKNGVAVLLNNIGSIHKNQNNYDEALKYYIQSSKLLKELESMSGVANIYNNIGNIHEMQTNYIDAKSYYLKAAKIAQEHNLPLALGRSRYNTANLFMIDNQLDSAVTHLTEALKTLTEIEAKKNIAETLTALGECYFKKGNNKLSKEYADRAFIISKEINHPEQISKSALLEFEILENQGQWKESLQMYKLHIQMRDSIFNSKNQKNVITKGLKYEYEKEKLLAKKEHEHTLNIANEKEKQKNIIIGFAIVFVILVIIFSITIYKRLQVTKEQKLIIEDTNEELNQTNEELATQRDEIEKQKEVVEETHKEITDSINYAKRIQNAILPSTSIIKGCLPHSFVLYKPKDVVAGDFYWLEQVGNLTLFAAADCTGHGVPGAMVSVVCHNAMNRAVREFRLTEPGLILDKTREIVVTEFEKSEDDVKDGMDIALCSINGNTLKYAGAHNPLLIIRNNELLETKADKQPIGKFDDPTPFITHSIDLQKGDTIYIYSDGYADQFGGDNDKKFGTKRLKELLLFIENKTMDDQKDILNFTFNNWIKEGESEQIDDVCIFGIKV